MSTSTTLIKDFERSARVEAHLEVLAAYFSQTRSNKKEPSFEEQLFSLHLQTDTQNHFLEMKRTIEQGLLLLLRHTDGLAAQQFDRYRETKHSLLTLIAFFMRLPFRIEEYEKNLRNHKPIQTICRIPNRIVHYFYTLAKEAETAQHYLEAFYLFSVLTLLDSSQAHFWVGLGNAAYGLQRHNVALLAYNIAAMMNPFHPSSYLFATNGKDALKMLDYIQESHFYARLVLGSELTAPMRKVVRTAHRYLRRSRDRCHNDTKA